MSEDETERSITARQEKTKYPRRVEAEKRLAAISKEAKEKKARERFAMEAINEEPEGLVNTSSILTIGLVLAVVLGGIYISKMNQSKIPIFKDTQTPQRDTPPSEPVISINFVSFDE